MGNVVPNAWNKHMLLFSENDANIVNSTPPPLTTTKVDM